MVISFVSATNRESTKGSSDQKTKSYWLVSNSDNVIRSDASRGVL